LDISQKLLQRLEVRAAQVAQAAQKSQKRNNLTK
jgi:hypothetical protein